MLSVESRKVDNMDGWISEFTLRYRKITMILALATVSLGMSVPIAVA
jgi:hypothetical protein